MIYGMTCISSLCNLYALGMDEEPWFLTGEFSRLIFIHKGKVRHLYDPSVLQNF